MPALRLCGRVLPSNHYPELTAWLNSQKRNCAHELAGVVVLDSFKPIARLIDSEHLNSDVRDRFRFARSGGTGLDPEDPIRRALEILRPAIEADLSDICADLHRHGIAAYPYQGLGVIWGDEIFRCAIRIDNPETLAEVLGIARA